MIVSNTSQCGLKHLYTLIDEVKHSETKALLLGTKIGSLLNHMQIGFQIKEANGVDLMILNRFANDVHIDKTYASNFFNASMNDTVNKSIESLIALSDIIDNDDDIPSEESGRNILPMGCLSFDITFTLSGASLTALTGDKLELLFSSDIESSLSIPGMDEEDNINPATDLFMTEFDEVKICQNATRLFLEVYYNFEVNELNKFDLGTDSMLSKYFYNYATKPNSITLSDINTIYGEINFLGNNALHLGEQLSAVKENDMYEYEAIFVARTSISNYLKLLKYVNDTEFLKVHFPIENEDGVGHTISKKYSNRVSENLGNILRYRSEHYKMKGHDIYNYAFLISSKQIKFCLKIKNTELNEFIEYISFQDDLRGGILDIKEQIVNLFKSINSTIR